MSANSPFVVYSPKNVCKLEYFTDEEDLRQDHSGGKDFQPEDLAIDCRGRVYRIHYNGTDYCYDLAETGEVWDHLKLLAVALADVRHAKQDPAVLERCVRDAPTDEKHRVIMEQINTLPSSPLSKVFGVLLILFLLAFAVAVCYGTARLFTWLTSPQ